MTRRTVKLLHTLGAIGLTGALGAYMILLATAPHDSLAGYAVVRASIRSLSHWLLVPSLMVVLVSGLASLAVHHPFQEAGWVWAKLLLGLPTFEWTLVTIDGTAQRAAQLSAQAAAGEIEPARMAALIGNEWTGLWSILALVVASTALGVYRPRLRRRRARA